MKIDPLRIVSLFDRNTRNWHTCVPDAPPPPTSILSLACKIHYFNFCLWHEEDKARMKGVADKTIAGVKRAIDKLNQSRNDSIEELDCFFLQENPPRKQNASARQNSETLGSMADRISVITLKIYHMALETRRKDAGDEHVLRCKEKHRILKIQRQDLARCFGELVGDIERGKRFFKVYRQFKMYNDPALNPMLYGPKK